MDNQTIINETYYVQQMVSNLMESMRTDVSNDVEFGHYFSERMKEIANKVRFLESECKD